MKAILLLLACVLPALAAPAPSARPVPVPDATPPEGEATDLLSPALMAIEEMTEKLTAGKLAALQATFDSRDAMQKWMKQIEEIDALTAQFQAAEEAGADSRELRTMLTGLRNRQNELAAQISLQLDVAQGQLTGLANRLQDLINEMDPANPRFLEGIPTFQDLKAVQDEGHELQRQLEEADRRLRFAEEQKIDPSSEEYFEMERRIQDLLFAIEDRMMLAQEMDLERRVASNGRDRMGINRQEFARARSATANISALLKRGQRRLQHIQKVNNLLERGNAFAEISGDLGNLYTQIGEIDTIIRQIQISEVVVDLSAEEATPIPRLTQADRAERVESALRLNWNLTTLRADYLPIDQP